MLNFDHQVIAKDFSQQLQTFLQLPLMSEWLGDVDWVDVDVWVWFDGATGFGNHPYVELDSEHQEHAWGSINCSLSFESIYIDQNHELFAEKRDQLANHLISACLYMLADFAKQENQNEIVEWINSQYLSGLHQSFLQELTEGQEKFSTQNELIMVLSFPTQGKLTPKSEDYALKDELVDIIDDCLKDQNVGYVDGCQIGGGSIELFCAIEDFEENKQLIINFLKARQLLLPSKCYIE